MRKTDAAWAAGFFDGEGTININVFQKSGPKRFMYYIGASQVRKEPLEKLRDLFGGTIHSYEHKGRPGRPYSVWRLGSSLLILNALQHMIPYLMVKQSEAELMIQWCENIRDTEKTGRRGHSEEEIRYREAMSKTMMVLR